VATFEHGFNFTWTTSDLLNAASLFYFKYQKKDDIASPWLRTTLITDNFYSITDLEPGTRYLFTLVATTGAEEHSNETESDSQLLKTAGNGKKNIFKYKPRFKSHAGLKSDLYIFKVIFRLFFN
jgi:hypothetical protein